jgi:hypothetical protein
MILLQSLIVMEQDAVLSRERRSKGILSTHLHSEGKYADKLLWPSPSIALVLKLCSR